MPAQVQAAQYTDSEDADGSEVEEQVAHKRRVNSTLN
jgi:hypothetical protein